MSQVNTVKKTSSPGERVQRLRAIHELTVCQLAGMAGVPVEHVMRFESDLPLPLDSKRRILKELWGRHVQPQNDA